MIPLKNGHDVKKECLLIRSLARDQPGVQNCSVYNLTDTNYDHIKLFIKIINNKYILTN